MFFCLSNSTTFSLKNWDGFQNSENTYNLHKGLFLKILFLEKKLKITYPGTDYQTDVGKLTKMLLAQVWIASVVYKIPAYVIKFPPNW